ESGRSVVFISLEKYRGVVVDKKNKLAVVKSGTLLGLNPELGFRIENETLIYILDAHGCALPGLTSVKRQTIGDYIAMGADEGSMKYSLYDAVVAIRLIDGKGNIGDFRKPSDQFYAAGISFGLFGIISTVTFNCSTPRYYVKGTQIISPIGYPSSDITKGSSVDLPPIKPYRLFNGTHTASVSTALASAYFDFDKQAANTPKYYKFAAQVLNVIQPIGVQHFFDIYYRALQQDEHLDYTVIAVALSELYFPVENATTIANILRNYYNTHGVKATSSNPIEMYAHRKHEFWLSLHIKQIVFDSAGYIWLEI
ncbi:unnamed protein product, partial [Didymodactylos carnosus]